MMKLAQGNIRTKVARNISFGSPIKGLMLYNDVSEVPDGGALILTNMVCQSDVVRVRRGAPVRNTGLAGSVTDFMSYANGVVRKAFAVAGTVTQNLFDITNPGGVGAAQISGLVPAIWSAVQFATSGGVYLVACGKGNLRRLYDGTSWASTPAITGVVSSAFSQVWVHGNRLFFVEAGTTNAWYLPVDSIGGAAIKFPLGGEFKNGGALLAGATWTSDSGGSGLKSSCVFLSTEGEIQVYEGPDPATWIATGPYLIAKPCGINCFMKAGGDLAIMTEDGLLAMSQIVSLDRAALVNESVSKNIRPLWKEYAQQSNLQKWTITRRDREGYAIINVPAGNANPAKQFVSNLQTGAWSDFSGWPAVTMAAFDDLLLIGMADGRVLLGEEGGMDDGQPYTATYVGPFKSPSGGNSVIARLMRATLRAIEVCQAQVSVIFDYSISLPTPPQACGFAGGSLWNVAQWNVDKWGGAKTIRNAWQSVAGFGSAVAPCVQYTIGQNGPPQIDLLKCDIEVEQGEVVT